MLLIRVTCRRSTRRSQAQRNRRPHCPACWSPPPIRARRTNFPAVAVAFPPGVRFCGSQSVPALRESPCFGAAPNHHPPKSCSCSSAHTARRPIRAGMEMNTFTKKECSSARCPYSTANCPTRCGTPRAVPCAGRDLPHGPGCCCARHDGRYIQRVRTPPRRHPLLK